jgi:opacity protein-like surface antigen
MNRFETRPAKALLLIATAGLMFHPAAARAAKSKSTRQLEQEIQALQQRNQQQEERLKALEQRLSEQAAPPAQQAAPPAAAVENAPQQDGTPPAAGDNSMPAQAAAPAQTEPATVNEMPKSVEDIYKEASGFAPTGQFSLETGITYTHYDTRNLVLNGFLALDSIFLGNIDVSRIKSDTLQLDETARYSPTPRLQFDANLPLVTRTSDYFSGGVGGASTTVSDSRVNQAPRLGDISFGVSYKAIQESDTWPDTVVSLHVKAPTGTNPYGIKLKTASGNDNLSVPQRLPTGNGLWAIMPGVSVVKTVDPAVLFASASYTHYFARSFGDISTTDGKTQPGKVQLGDTFQLGAGMAFALNDRLSLGLSYSQLWARKSRIKNDGQDWQNIVGSDANAGTLNLGLTYAVNRHLSIVPNLAVGLTPDAPNYAFSVKFPYYF